MKFNIKVIFSLLISLSMAAGFTSCKDNDDIPEMGTPEDVENPEGDEGESGEEENPDGSEEEPGDEENIPPLKDINIYHFENNVFTGISSLYNVSYFINEQNPFYVPLDILIGNNGEWSSFCVGIDRKNNKMFISGSPYCSDEVINFTPQGFISDFSYNTEQSYSGITGGSGTYKKIKYTFTYDSFGHLISLTSVTDTDYISDSIYSPTMRDIYTVTETISLIWENGNIVKMSNKYQTDYPNDPEFLRSDIKYAEYNITYGSTENQTRQYIQEVSNMLISESRLVAFPSIGLLGIGTAKIPVLIEGTDYKLRPVKMEINTEMKDVGGVKVIGKSTLDNTVYRYNYSSLQLPADK